MSVKSQQSACDLAIRSDRLCGSRIPLTVNLSCGRNEVPSDSCDQPEGPKTPGLPSTCRDLASAPRQYLHRVVPAAARVCGAEVEKGKK